VRWDGQGYFLKLGIWTLTSKPPAVTIRQIGDAQLSGTASFFPTTAGLPGPLPTQLSFPNVGCWEVTAAGSTGRAVARIMVDEAAKSR
jgi:hypothetical protein